MIKIAILDDDKTALMISTATVEAFLKEKNAEYPTGAVIAANRR